MAKRLIAVTANNVEVFGIENDEHMIAHSQVQEKHIAEAIAEITLEAPFFMESIDLWRHIGYDNCIEVTDKDDCHYMRRIGRKGDSHIVFGKRPAPTTLITIGICLDDDGLYTLFTAFYGQKAPKEPWDCRTDDERAESEEFWANHALVYTRGEDFTINPERFMVCTPHDINVVKGAEFSPAIRKYTGGEVFGTIPTHPGNTLNAKFKVVQKNDEFGVPSYTKEVVGCDEWPEDFDGIVIASALYASAYQKLHGTIPSNLRLVSDPVMSDDGKSFRGCRGIAEF